ncbi:hypothetical protein IJT17_08805 [bacterium]|nr:hypothetical protein [bacterium]
MSRNYSKKFWKSFKETCDSELASIGELGWTLMKEHPRYARKAREIIALANKNRKDLDASIDAMAENGAIDDIISKFIYDQISDIERILNTDVHEADLNVMALKTQYCNLLPIKDDVFGSFKDNISSPAKADSAGRSESDQEEENNADLAMEAMISKGLQSMCRSIRRENKRQAKDAAAQMRLRAVRKEMRVAEAHTKRVKAEASNIRRIIIEPLQKRAAEWQKRCSSEL